jgi:MFS family permease
VARLFVDLSPLRESRDFRFLFGGQLVSMMGNQLTVVAIPYQVYTQTHSSLTVGLVSLIQLPLLISGSLWGGAVGDRVDRRKVMVACAIVLSLLSAGLALNAATSRPNLVLLIALAALAAGFAGFSNPARNAAIPRLVPATQLVGAYSLNQVGIQIATVVGPALSGVLLATVGLSWCYWIDATSFLVVIGTSLALSPIVPLASAVRVSTLRAVRDGFSYVRSHVAAQCVYLVDLSAMVFGMPRALFPAVAATMYHGGPVTVGLLFAAPGVGALLGAVTTGWVERVSRRGRAVVLAVVLWGVAIALFGLSPWTWLGLVMLAVAGWADVISAVLRNTILQSSISDEFRSRISSIQMAVVTGGPRLGDLESGAVASATSTEISIVSGGILCVLGAVAIVRWRPAFWREALTSS